MQKVSLTATQRHELKSLTHNVLLALLQLQVVYDLTEHRINEGVQKWSGLTEQLHIEQYPIKGVGIIATPSNLSKLRSDDGGYLHDEEDVAPDDMISLLGEFPLAAASASYAFTMLEQYGDDVVQIVNPSFAKPRSSWHRSIYGDLDGIEPKDLTKLRAGFARPFKADFVKVNVQSIMRLIALKNARNDFAHRGKAEIDFRIFVGFSLGIVAQIYFLCLPKERELKKFPWPDFSGKWRT